MSSLDEHLELIDELRRRLPLFARIVGQFGENTQEERIPWVFGFFLAAAMRPNPGACCFVLDKTRGTTAIAAVLLALVKLQDDFPELLRNYALTALSPGQRVRVKPSDFVYEYGEPPSRIPKHRGPKRTAACILDQPGVWSRSPLNNGRRAAATLERANRALSALGGDLPFQIVYYGSDGAGGWQPLTVPLRTITTLDRFALCEPTDVGPMLRMLQAPELAREMGFDDNLILKQGHAATGS